MKTFDYTHEEMAAYHAGLADASQTMQRALLNIFRIANERDAMSRQCIRRADAYDAHPDGGALAAMQADADRFTAARYKAQAEGMRVSGSTIASQMHTADTDHGHEQDAAA